MPSGPTPGTMQTSPPWDRQRCRRSWNRRHRPRAPDHDASPYGSIDAASGAVAEELHPQPILWTAQALRLEAVRHLGANRLDIEARTAPGAVVLLHDGGGDRSRTVAALKELLPYWKAQGY